MTITAFRAAKLLINLSDYSLNNSQINRILYIANMIYLGRIGKPLILETFKSSDYGPIIPILHKKLEIYGNKPIRDVFFSENYEIDPDILHFMEKLYDTLDVKLSKLIAITHRIDGGWEKNYNPDIACVTISNSDIISEYNKYYKNN